MEDEQWWLDRIHPGELAKASFSERRSSPKGHYGTCTHSISFDEVLLLLDDRGRVESSFFEHLTRSVQLAISPVLFSFLLLPLTRADPSIPFPLAERPAQEDV
jgi:hypothetical protein